MKTYTSDISWRLIAIAWFAFCLTSTFVSTADPRSPTPRPGSLAAYAEKVTLDRSTLSDHDGRLILTNESVAALATGGAITLGIVKQANLKKTKKTVDNAERSRWQNAHHNQKEVIVALERRRVGLEVEIDRVENLSLTAKTMASLDLLETKLLQLDRDIAAERAELARIVRDARRRGAEPGWFR
jgi:hypothetical protein